MLINIYKPTKMTSHDVVDEVRKITGERRVGHAGTLDPFAEGVLVVGIGRESTRKLGEVSKGTDKEYIATLELGKRSSTGDPEGDISEGEDKEKIYKLNKEYVLKVIDGFKGEIEQLPPRYSAVKIKGKPAYKYAREGKEIEMKKRKINVYKIELIDLHPPFLVIGIACSSGTYIRTLAEDIGESLGVGAYLLKLVRTRVGDFKLEDSLSLEDFQKQGQ